jgi:hypothetical protein
MDDLRHQGSVLAQAYQDCRHTLFALGHADALNAYAIPDRVESAMLRMTKPSIPDMFGISRRVFYASARKTSINAFMNGNPTWMEPLHDALTRGRDIHHRVMRWEYLQEFMTYFKLNSDEPRIREHGKGFLMQIPLRESYSNKHTMDSGSISDFHRLQPAIAYLVGDEPKLGFLNDIWSSIDFPWGTRVAFGAAARPMDNGCSIRHLTTVTELRMPRSAGEALSAYISTYGHDPISDDERPVPITGR